MSSTSTIELQPIALQAPPPAVAKHGPRDIDQEPLRNAVDEPGRSSVEFGGAEPDDTPHAVIRERWNRSKTNVFRVAAIFWSFFIMGANDAAYGALIPSLEKYYNLSYTVVSMVFISPLVGYILSAALNNWLHHTIGQRGIALLAGGCHLSAYIIIAAHPPYVVIILAFILAGLSNGLADAAWNAYIGNLANPSELLGLMHACYGAGGVFSPSVSTAMITEEGLGLPWYNYYYILIGLAAIEVVALTWSFWSVDGAAYKRIYNETEIERESGLTSAILTMPTARVSWVCAFFLLFYVGVEVALGGWIVVFMTRVRGGEAFASGMTATGFWLGITLGRVVLGFVTPRIGVKIATTVYIALTIGLELLFWLVPQFYVSAVAVALQGFFLGPLFPNVVLVASKILPRHQHVVVIGFAAALGGCGGAILPFAVGVLAQTSGVQVLQPIILAMLCVMIGLWLCLPRLKKRQD